MKPGPSLRRARIDAGFTQAELAQRAGTSQATISAYENGAKLPSLPTLSRLLAVTGCRLGVSGLASGGPSSREMERRGRILAEVIALAEALPARRRGPLRYPRLNTLRAGVSE